MRPTIEQLSAYLDQRLSERAIAKLHGTTRDQVHGWLRFRKAKPKRIYAKPSPEQVAVGVTLGLSERDIGRLWGISRSCVACIREKAGIPAAGKPRQRLAGRVWRDAKPHRVSEQGASVRLLADESAWHRALNGQRYGDAATNDGGYIRLLPVASLSGNSSMAGWAW